MSNLEQIPQTPFFKAVTITFSQNEFTINGPIDINFPKKDTANEKYNLNSNSLSFTDTSGKKISMNDIISQELPKHLSVCPIGSPFLLDIKSGYSFATGESYQPISRLLIPMVVSVETINLNVIVNVCHNQEGEIIGNTGVCSGKVKKQLLHFFVSEIEKDDKRNLKIKVFDRNLKPYPLNGLVHLYGVNKPT